MQIIIQSENNHLLDILYKNPATDLGLYAKELRNGVLIGNAVSANEYHCLFQDTKNSYLLDEGNPIDFQSYCSPLLALNMATEFFNHLFKSNETLESTTLSWLGKTYPEIDTLPANVIVPTFFIDSGWYKNGTFLLSKYIDGILVTPKIGNNYQLAVKGKNIRETLHKFSVVALFCHFTNKHSEYMYIDDYFVQKHITILANLSNVPYFVYYLFIKRLMRSPEQFRTFKPQLEAYFNNTIQFAFTDTHQSRKEFICNRIENDEAVLDFGCGNLQYFKKLRKKGFIAEYLAHDEEDFEATVDKIIEYENVENLHWIANKEDLKGFYGQVILSEVIEHNTLEEAKDLLYWIKENISFTKLFITTPNSEFNVNYEMTDEFRHDDHDFELSKQEFMELIASIFPNKMEYHGIGDCVNGIYPTSAMIVYNANY